MRIPNIPKTIFAAAVALLAAAVLAGTAYAITVYVNNFSSKNEMQELVRSGGGKACDRAHRAKRSTMRVTVHKGPVTCAFRAPVQGDSELPNHALGVDAKILKETPKSVRDAAFVELTLRAGGGGTGYALRIFPGRRRFELDRGPSGGGDFPTRGKDRAIKGINDRNQISLVVKGARVTAKVNGKELASVVDNNPGQVTGRKVRFGIGSAKKSSKDVLAVLKSVSVGVPTRR